MTMTEIQELLDWQPPRPGDAKALETIVAGMTTIMPEDWKEWKIHNLESEDLLGDPPDPKIVNKLRFAIPTGTIISAFGLAFVRKIL